jgi:CRISPR-associated protein Cas6
MTSKVQKTPTDEPIVELAYPVRGTTVAADHAYPLYAAITSQCQAAHQAEWLGIHHLTGVMRTAQDELTLTDHTELRLRLPVGRVADVLPLAGKSLQVGSGKIMLGAPAVHALAPAASLDASIVVIRLTEMPKVADEHGGQRIDQDAFRARFTEEAVRQLRAQGVLQAPTLCGLQRLRVKDDVVLGFAVRVEGLNDEASLALQRVGVGGKRRLGCGLFRPSRPRS